ncbi:hypothetical protein OB915_27090, partial [Klebsiella pneumoniae]|nr:hypothetical protein [Klebsiella pneumoniae]
HNPLRGRLTRNLIYSTKPQALYNPARVQLLIPIEVTLPEASPLSATLQNAPLAWFFYLGSSGGQEKLSASFLTPGRRQIRFFLLSISEKILKVKSGIKKPFAKMKVNICISELLKAAIWLYGC